jgi:hypothetical protein
MTGILADIFQYFDQYPYSLAYIWLISRVTDTDADTDILVADTDISVSVSAKYIG